MRVLFLGSLCRDENHEKELIARSSIGIQNSIIRFQWSLIKGIEANTGKPVDIISMLPIGTYPRYYRQLLFRTVHWSHHVGAMDLSLGFINLPFLKQIMLILRARHEIARWIERNKGRDELCIVMYDLLLPYLIALRRVKARYPRVLTCSVVADLPNEYGYEKGDRGLERRLRRLMGRIQLNEVRRMDCYALLTDQMKYPLGIDSSSYVVIEGIVDPEQPYEELTDSDKRIILYTGALKKIYGLDTLLDAFTGIESDRYELWLCGTGDYQSVIMNRSKVDSRIKYLGYCTKEVVSGLQLRSTVLINPRKNADGYTKYSFPSKIMEYLATGRPVIAYRLDGIPDEYYRHIICPKDDTTQALRDAITKVCEMPADARRKIGNAGRRFVLETKNPREQCRKLIDLIQTRIGNPDKGLRARDTLLE